MPKLVAVLSSPVRLRDGVFAVVFGSVAGVNVKEFSTKDDANRYFRSLRVALSMAPELTFKFILIENETEYSSLRPKFDDAYERICNEPGLLVSLGKMIREQVRKYIS
jgi:hypothetical protein